MSLLPSRLLSFVFTAVQLLSSVFLCRPGSLLFYAGRLLCSLPLFREAPLLFAFVPRAPLCCLSLPARLLSVFLCRPGSQPGLSRSLPLFPLLSPFTAVYRRLLLFQSAVKTGRQRPKGVQKVPRTASMSLMPIMVIMLKKTSL